MIELGIRGCVQPYLSLWRRHKCFDSNSTRLMREPKKRPLREEYRLLESDNPNVGSGISIGIVPEL